MAEIILTNHEKGLIAQIHGEIQEMNNKSNHLAQQIDQTPANQADRLDSLVNELEGLSKRVSERSIVRQNIIREAWNRLQKNK